MSDFGRINAQELDRHITGNYGEDSVDTSFEEIFAALESLCAAYASNGNTKAQQKAWAKARAALAKVQQ